MVPSVQRTRQEPIHDSGRLNALDTTRLKATFALETRSFDQSSHTYLGYALRVRGTVGDEAREFLVGIGKEAFAKHQFQMGDIVSGVCERVADPTVAGPGPRSPHVSRARPPAPFDANLRGALHVVHLGLPHGGRDDHRPVESVAEAVSGRDVLLRAEVVPDSPSRPDARRARAEGNEACRGGLGR
jgi:hypothetical protein